MVVETDRICAQQLLHGFCMGISCLVGDFSIARIYSELEESLMRYWTLLSYVHSSVRGKAVVPYAIIFAFTVHYSLIYYYLLLC